MRQWIGIAALAIAACGGNGDGAGGNDAAAESNAAAGGGGGGAASAAMQPGQWEITTTVASISVPNMPSGMAPPVPPPTTVRSCLTPEEASQPNANFLTGMGESGGCTYENQSMEGGRVQSTVQCSSGGATMRTVVSGQFTPTSFEVNQRATTSAQGMNMEIESRTAGRRIGDCPAAG